MPGIPLLTKFSDVAGAVTPVASEFISLLLVKILQCFLLLFLMKKTTTTMVIIIIIWEESSFSLRSGWDA